MLENLAPRSMTNIMRNTVTDISRETRDEARSRVRQRTGTLRKAIKAKRRRGEPDVAAAGVYITKGSGEKHDAWYWHFIEWGTQKMSAMPFLTPAIEAIRGGIDELLGRYFLLRFNREIERLARRRAKGKG